MIALGMLFHMRPSVNRSVHVFHPIAINHWPFYLLAITFVTSLRKKHHFWEEYAAVFALLVCAFTLLPASKTMNFGLDSLSLRGSFLWNTLDDSIKEEPTLACFQKRISK